MPTLSSPRRPGRRGRFHSRAASAAVVACALTVLSVGGAAAQTFRGTVLEEGSERPVATAFVRLVDRDGEPLRGTFSDSTGRFDLEAPGPGAYRLEVRQLGFMPFESSLLAVRDSTRAYGVELLLEPEPIPVDELRVTAERRTPREVREKLAQQIGLDPAALRWDPILRPAIEEHVERAHDVRQMIRWASISAVVVQGKGDDLCFAYRTRYCLPVFLDGVPVRPEFVSTIPLEALEAAVVLSPTESVTYGSGGVLLYTSGWVR